MKRFALTVNLPKEIAKTLFVKPFNPIVDPDTLWRTMRMGYGWEEGQTFALLRIRETSKWEYIGVPGTLTHGEIPSIPDIWRESLPEKSYYDKVILGRWLLIGEDLFVAFWPGVSRDLRITNQIIMQVALPQLMGELPRHERLWVSGIDGRIIQQPGQTSWYSAEEPKKRYTVGVRDYSYAELAQSLHALPKASPERQRIEDFIRSTDVPELQGLKARLSPKSKAQVPTSPKMFDLYRPENLESLGTQSRIDKYWDARTSSRRVRIALRLRV